MGNGMKIFVLVGLLLILSGCNDKPEHYLVLCDQQDSQGWSLIDTVKTNGYIMSCTYQSPDKQMSYARVCDSSGCNIKK